MGTHLAGYILLLALAAVLLATYIMLRIVIHGGRRIDGLSASYGVVVPQLLLSGIFAFNESFRGLTATVMIPYYCLVFLVALAIPYPD